MCMSTQYIQFDGNQPTALAGRRTATAVRGKPVNRPLILFQYDRLTNPPQALPDYLHNPQNPAP